MLMDAADPSLCALLQDIAIIKIEQCCFAMLNAQGMPARAGKSSPIWSLKFRLDGKNKLSNHYLISWLELHSHLPAVSLGKAKNVYPC